MTTVAYRDKTSVMHALAERVARRGTPISAMIEIADRCNEVCVHCYQVQGQKGEMTTEQVFTVLEELAAMGVLLLTISGGEATLRGDFLDIVRRARELEFAVKLYTNGLTMTPELADELARLAVQEAQISLYSHRADLHDWVTRVPGSWSRTTNAVRLLRARRIAVVVKTPLMTINSSREDRDAYVALAAALDADWAFDPSVNGREDDDRSPEAFRIPDDAYVELLRDRHVNDPARGLAPMQPASGAMCGACSASIVVEPNGEVRPCSAFTVPLGDAITDGIAASYTHSAAAKGIRGLSWETTLGCASCEINGHCHRCHANSRLESGDARAPYPSACRSARLHYAAAIEGEVVVESTDGDESGVGPYAVLSHGRLRRVPYQQTDADRALLAALPFLARAPGESPTPIAPGDLVQIRRPGKKPTLEQVPAATKPAAT